MARRFDGAKRDDWRRRLTKFDASGLTVGAFCRLEQVSQASFYYWSRRIRDRDVSMASEMKPPDAGLATSPIREGDESVEILIGDSIRVRMPVADPAAVAALVKQLQAASQVATRSATTNRFQRIELTA
jgi:hypothetical protein